MAEIPTGIFAEEIADLKIMKKQHLFCYCRENVHIQVQHFSISFRLNVSSERFHLLTNRSQDKLIRNRLRLMSGKPVRNLRMFGFTVRIWFNVATLT